jgi:hypothetical protein
MIGLNSLSNTSGLACMIVSAQSEADRPSAGWANTASGSGETEAVEAVSSGAATEGPLRACGVNAIQSTVARLADRESSVKPPLHSEAGVMRTSIARLIFAIAAKVRFYP